MMQKNKKKRKHVRFEGYFNARIRKLLFQKRMELGLAYQEVAIIFEVNWSTARKWEQGVTLKCRPRYRRLIEDYLNGNFDHLLSNKEELSVFSATRKFPWQIASLSERILEVYSFLRANVEFQKNFIDSINKCLDDNLKKFKNR